MKQLSKYVNKDSLKQYYDSYILPIFDYGCLIWSRCSVTNTNRMLKLQKRAARITLKAEIMTPSETMFNKLQWLSFTKRTQYHKYIMMFKALNGQTPSMFTKTAEIHNRHLRSVANAQLRVPFSRTTYFENSFIVNGAKLWNSLPNELREKTRYKLRQKRYQIIPAQLGLIFFCLNVLQLPTKLEISLSPSSFFCDCTVMCLPVELCSSRARPPS